MTAPAVLRDEVARTLRPVRPLAPPWRRAAVPAALGLIALFGLPLALGLRGDAWRLGPALTWGASAAVWCGGALVILLALREAIPSRQVPRAVLAMLAAAAGAAWWWVMVATAAASPTVVPAGRARLFFTVCLLGPLLAATPPLAVALALVRRADALRPGVAGALCGLGAGLLADSGWRLFCHVSAPSHVLGAHLLAVVLCGVLGALAMRLLAEARRR